MSAFFPSLKLSRLTSLLVSGWLLGASLYSHGQSLFPRQFLMVDRNLGIVNPAAEGFDRPWNIDASTNMLRSSAFEGVSFSYLNAFVNLGRSVSEDVPGVHALSLSVSTDREGQLLSRNRFLAGYGIKRLINGTLCLQAAAQVGAFSYVVRATNASAGGGATAFDGRLGIWLAASRWNTGVTLHQIFGTSFVPFSSEVTLDRFPEWYGSWYHQFANQSQLQFLGDVRFIPSNMGYVFGTLYSWKSGVQVGLAFNDFSQLISRFGVREMNLWTMFVDVSVGYATSGPGGGINQVDQVELTLSLY